MPWEKGQTVLWGQKATAHCFAINETQSTVLVLRWENGGETEWGDSELSWLVWQHGLLRTGYKWWWVQDASRFAAAELSSGRGSRHCVQEAALLQRSTG